MPTSRSKQVLTSAILALLIFVNACASKSAAPPVQTTGGEIKERVLTLWTHEFPTFQDALNQKWIPEFEAANPGVKVEYTAIPFAGSLVSYNTKVLAALSGGGGPDVWDIPSWDFTENNYIEAGLVAPLDPAIFGYKSVDDMISDHPANSMDVFIRDGKIYALFNELTTLCLFYNQDMFDDAGIAYLSADEPDSWQHILEISQQMRKTDSSTGKPTQIGYQFGFFAAFPSPQWYAQAYYPFLRQNGQSDIYLNGQPAADTPAAIQAFQMMYDFTQTGAYDPNFLQNWFTDLPNGRVAMVAAGPWLASAMRSAKSDVRFGVAPLPVMEPGNSNTYQNIMYSYGWAVNPNSDPDQQQLAQEFLAFILGEKGEAEQAVWWFEHVGVMQPRGAFLNSPQYQETLQRDPWLNCFSNTFNVYQVEYVQHSYDEAGSALIRAIDRVVYNQMPPEDSALILQNELILLR